jgi:redox-sensitive bicupin YhaK (pirin superfamily)
MVKKARPPQYFTRILPPSEQATGSFDQGSITEQKMIGFAGEGSKIHRMGPLYYWAWAHADRPASIEPHPHRGFEIMTYVLAGTIEHRDSLGHVSRISAGGLQLMQTGSGVEHEEHFVQTPAESLQIWLDPHFRQQVEVPPRYYSYTSETFPRMGSAKVVLGGGSPVSLFTPDVAMQDVILSAGEQITGTVAGGIGWAAIVIAGEGKLVLDGQNYSIQCRDFVVHQGEHAVEWVLSSPEDLRLIWISAPLVLPYALFPKPR